MLKVPAYAYFEDLRVTVYQDDTMFWKFYVIPDYISVRRDQNDNPVFLLIKYAFGARVENEQNIPATGGVILASNHLDAGDTVVLPAMVKRPVTFPAKAELFAGNRGPFSKLVAWFLKAVGQVPLDRSGGRASLDGLGPVLAVLAARAVLASGRPAVVVADAEMRATEVR